MTFDQNAFLIILTGTLISVSCGLLGCFLILRKMAMIGDAISHAVLPGIVLAFFFSQQREGIAVIIGAGLLGVLATLIIDYLSSRVKLQNDAAIGVTFTWLFAIGIILITLFAGRIDLDQDCVLYGEIAYIPIDLWILTNGTVMGPRVLYVAIINVILVILYVLYFYKELKLTSFDPAFASSIGISTVIINLSLMGMVSYTTVSSFEAVGAILVLALLVVPPAAAYLLTTNLKYMLALTLIFGFFTSLLGYYLAYYIDGSIAGAMASVAGIILLGAIIYANAVKRPLILSKA